MKKVISTLFIFATLFFVFSATPVLAKVITDENGTVTVAKSEVVNDDLFIGSHDAVIDGVVNGDVFIGAQTVKVTGIINGNLHIASRTVDLSGTVKGNVYAAGQNIFVSSSKIGGSFIAAGSDIGIDKDSVVGGSVIVGAGTFSVDSQIKRSLYAGTGSLLIGSDTKIGKDLYYAADNQSGSVNISPSAKVLGSTYKTEVNSQKVKADTAASKKELASVFGGIKVVSTIISFVGALLVGFIYSKFFKKNFTESSKLVCASFWKSLGVGFLITISFIPGVVILLMTVVGIPVAGLAILVLMLYSYLTKIIVGFAVGTFVSQKFKWNIPQYAVFSIGLIVVYVIKMLPIFGFFIGLTVFWVGLGALTLQVFSKSE